jgi:predicted ArsR family transcriptional regulator
MQPRPPATRAEARALAHPIRLRVIRLAKDQALTVSQLSELLGLGKATVLHHVRTLLREGFLSEAPQRRSAAGRPEKPYRSTRKSLTITFTDTPELPLAVLDAFRKEVADHEDPSPVVARRRLRLNDASRTEFVARLGRLVDEFDARDEPDCQPVNFLAIAVRDSGPPA